MSPIRVLIADDQILIREGMKIVFDQIDDIVVVETVLNGLDLFEKVALHLPDLLIMDMQIPIKEGLISLLRIKRHFPETVVLMLITFFEDDELLEALIYGASGYLLKDISKAKMIDCIRDAVSGELVLPSAIAAKLASRLWMS
jgi:DNA-binding NarL/FixJ family response regulator